ncbi:MAG: ATP-binding cassette domain-containing protein [Chloroflexota bacterium]|nr:ATP-binding cassette domain-containing protein [Chloroflexota bacterium]
MLTVSNVSRSLGGQRVISSVSFVLNPGERLGLIGPNGAGKSTLLRILGGFDSPDSGAVAVSPGERIGMLRQGFADLADGTLADLLDSATGGLAGIAAEVDRVLGASDGSDEWLIEYDAAQSRFDALGGYEAVADLEVSLAAFGLGDRAWTTPLNELSGGEKTRAGLAALIVSRPDYLLLDEPTNHLDAEGQRFLAEMLNGYAGGVIVVSHDRRFLDAIATGILALDEEREGVRQFAGTYTDYRQTLEYEAAEYASAYRRQQEEIARIRGDIRAVASHALATETATQNDYLRGRSKKVARTAKVRERKLERLLESGERLDRPERHWTMAANFGEVAETGRDVAILAGVSVIADERTLLRDVDLLVRSGDRIAVTGPNGAGKTTLLKIVAGELEPSGGTMRLGANVRVGWFAQEQETLRGDLTPVQLVRLRSEMSESEARTYLHRFLFTARNVVNPIASLSYGERSRLALAVLVLDGCNLLLLDEPLNHLDIESREQFEIALAEYRGTLLIVLHDEYAIERIANRLLRLRDGEVTEELI